MSFEESYGKALAAVGGKEQEAFEVSRQSTPGRKKSIVFLSIANARRKSNEYVDATITRVWLGPDGKIMRRGAEVAPHEMPIRDIVKGDPGGAYVVVRKTDAGKTMYYTGQGYERSPAVWTYEGKKALRYNTDSAAKRVAEATGGECVQVTFHLQPEHGELGHEGPRGQGGGKWSYEHLLASYGSWAKACLAGKDPRDAADKVRTDSADDIHFTTLYRMGNFVGNAQRKAKDAIVFVIHEQSPKGKSSKVWTRLCAWGC